VAEWPVLGMQVFGRGRDGRLAIVTVLDIIGSMDAIRWQVRKRGTRRAEVQSGTLGRWSETVRRHLSAGEVLAVRVPRGVTSREGG
jgi:hypothetical protein